MLGFLVGALLLSAAVGLCQGLFEDQLVVPLAQVGKYGPRGMPGDIVELADGTLLLCYTQDGIKARKSADGGKTWGEEFVLVANPGPPSRQGYYCHPSFLRLANGEILLSYIYGSGAVPYYGHNYYRRSGDEGQTWTEQFLCTPYPGYIIMHNDKMMQLSTGRILAACEYKKRWPDSNDHGGYVAMVCTSDDDGYSWQVSNDVDMEPHEAQEPHVVELKDGRLLMVFRTYSGVLGRAYSEDGGRTWGEGELLSDMALPMSGAVTIVRLPRTEDLLLIRITGGADGRRTPLTTVISQDEGLTWQHPRNIGEDPEDDYGYQSVTFVDDVAVISYHARDGLHVARIGVDWFYGAQ